MLKLSYLSKEELADDQREALGAQIAVREAHEIELASWRHVEIFLESLRGGDANVANRTVAQHSGEH